MAQTRRIGKHNERAYLLSAPRFFALPQWADHRALRPLALSPCRLLKLTRLGSRRAKSERKAYRSWAPRYTIARTRSRVTQPPAIISSRIGRNSWIFSSLSTISITIGRAIERC